MAAAYSGLSRGCSFRNSLSGEHFHAQQGQRGAAVLYIPRTQPSSIFRDDSVPPMTLLAAAHGRVSTLSINDNTRPGISQAQKCLQRLARTARPPCDTNQALSSHSLARNQPPQRSKAMGYTERPDAFLASSVRDRSHRAVSPPRRRVNCLSRPPWGAALSLLARTSRT